MKVDYMLHHIINNYVDDDYVVHYDYIRSEIWFSKQELCDEVSQYLGIEIPLNKYVIVTKEQMEDTHKLLTGRKDLIGIYGDWYLNEWVYKA